MIHFENDTNPAMRFEGLARAAFNNCNKSGDPWGYAAQDKYNNFVLEPDSLISKRILSTILIKLVLNYENTEYMETFINLENDVWSLNSQEECINIIDNAISILKQIEE